MAIQRCCRTCAHRGKYLLAPGLEICRQFPAPEDPYHLRWAYDAWLGPCGQGLGWEPAPLLERLRRRLFD